MQEVSLFARLLPASFDELPGIVQRVHDARVSKHLNGRCDVQRGKGLLAKCLAALASLPPSQVDAPLSVAIAVDAAGETWRRDFDGHRMQSRLWAHGALLAERLGPVTLLFSLHVEDAKLIWRVAGAHFLGAPLPASWFAGAGATEQVVDGRYRFDVRATLPLVGLLVHYNGWLAE